MFRLDSPDGRLEVVCLRSEAVMASDYIGVKMGYTTSELVALKRKIAEGLARGGDHFVDDDFSLKVCKDLPSEEEGVLIG